MNPQARLHTTPARRRLSVNITPVERAGRVVLGVAAIIAAVMLLTSAGSGLASRARGAVGGGGLDLAVTGALGHCPLYGKLGFVPASLRRSS